MEGGAARMRTVPGRLRMRWGEPPVTVTLGSQEMAEEAQEAPDPFPEPFPQPGGRGGWPLGLVGGALLPAGVFYAFLPRPPPPPQFETVRVERGRITARVTATGTLSAVTTVQVGSQVSGRVNELFVDFNTPV